MKKKYSKKEFLSLSNEELREVTKGKAVDFHFFNKQPTQLGRNDFHGYDAERGYFYTKTGIEIDQHTVDNIEIID
jgi:hypothetical protein